MEIRPGLRLVESTGQVVYVLHCGGAYTLVDVGGEADWPRKVEALRAEGIALSQIAAVLITHFHEDHCGGLIPLRKQAAPRVVTHRYSLEPMTATPPIDSALVDCTVEDGDRLEIGPLTLTAHHLPGHTHDSVAYQLEGEFFVGDITFEWAGIGWMDIHWGSCVPQYRESLQRLLALGPSRIYPGHGEPSGFTAGMLNRALTHLEVLEKVDGSPIVVGRPAPLRPAEEARRLLRVA